MPEEPRRPIQRCAADLTTGSLQRRNCSNCHASLDSKADLTFSATCLGIRSTIHFDRTKTHKRGSKAGILVSLQFAEINNLV